MGLGEVSDVALLERERELAVIDRVIGTVTAASGCGVILAGPAGIGKTELMRAAVARARAAGLEVLSASGGELERELGLGVIRQLFEARLVRASAAERAELLEGPAAAAARLFGIDTEPPGAVADDYRALNGVYWLCVRLAERAPLMLAVDDVHWADEASLRWLAYLVRRLDELPLLLVLARRSDEPGADERLLGQIGSEPLVEELHPGPLSRRAIGQIVRDASGEPPGERFLDACGEASGGNPLFCRQLVAAADSAGLRPLDANTERIRELAPKRVSEIVTGRLARLPEPAARLAEAAAVLGLQADFQSAASLAGLEEREAARAADALAAAAILRTGQPLEFAHPVIRASVYASIPAVRRASDHGRAARLLSAQRAAPARVAIHLLEAPPAADPWAVEILCAAASAELLPETRTAYLRRALEEPAPPEARARILLDLGRAEALTYDPRAVEHLDQGLQATADPLAQAAAAAELAMSLLELGDDAGRATRVVTMLREHIGRLARAAPERGTVESELLLRLEWVLADVTPGPTRERLDELISLAGEGGTPGELELLAYAAACAADLGYMPSEVVALAERALSDGILLGADDLIPFHFAVWGLEVADRLDAADRLLLQAQEETQRRGSPNQLMFVSGARAHNAWQRGALADAEQDARAALELARMHGRHFSTWNSASALVLSLTDQGRLEEAEQFLATDGFHRDNRDVVYALARLQYACGCTPAALENFVAAGGGHDPPGYHFSWRVGAALASLRLGRREEAEAFAREQLERARSFGAAGPTGVALRALGLVEGGARGLELLAEAVAELERSPALLERAKAKLSLGAVLRRAKKRAAAQEPLRSALDLADRCGAVPLAEAAREELICAGARPRRTRMDGPEALTAGEMRVVRRAVAGRTNREIAEDLFVTVKAVEKHLANAYRKLGIARREELFEALRADAA